ncbi:hypothetical protein M885DRAFT_583960 [Pelagophyceae sp. CCMP2097]|nr:hypothetical protein M885DRAFT_583960 [Pelagophyceae sp. CCMP2097]
MIAKRPWRPREHRGASGPFCAMASAAEAAEQIGVALGFEGTVSKTGYLTKRAKKSGANWKKRYFVLNGSSLVYYETHKQMAEAKGDMLLTTDCVIHDVQEAKYQHCFEIVSVFDTLRIAASSDAEAAEWKAALLDSISQLGSRTRGFVDVRVKGTFGSMAYQRKFFVLHSAALTYHADHKSTYRKQGEFKLEATTKILLKQDPPGLELQTGGKVLRLGLGDAAYLDLWYQGIAEVLAKLAARDDLASKRGRENDEEVILDGYVGTQPAVRPGAARRDEGDWPKKFYALTASALYQADHDSSVEASAVFLVDPTCSVYLTRLRANAFEVVTPHGVLHLQGATKQETSLWVAALRSAIASSTGLSSDPLLAAAKQRDLLETFTIHFQTKQKLNIVLERAAEWAVVKESRKDEVGEGSALLAVNGQSTMLQPYAETIRALTGWEPPLSLTFARPPQRAGWLAKRARGRTSSVLNWKQRYFILQDSKLSYFGEADRPDSLRDCVHLMGSVVSLVSKTDSGGLNFCFKVTSGVAVVIMQATTLEDMVDWATTLYHSIAIANGGGYLLDVERKRAATAGAAEQAAQGADAARKGDATSQQRDAADLARRLQALHEAQERQVLDEMHESEAQRRAAEAQQVQQAQAPQLPRRGGGAQPAAAEPAWAPADERLDGPTVARGAASSPASPQAADDDDDGIVYEARGDRGAASGGGGASASDAPPPPPVDDGGESSDDEAEGPASPTRVDLERAEAAENAEMLSTPLTNGELADAFAVVKGADYKGYINPMQFVSLLRAVGVSDHNLKAELDLFHAFDTRNAGSLTIDDFLAGFRNYIDNHGTESSHVQEIIIGIRNYQNKGTVVL